MKNKKMFILAMISSLFFLGACNEENKVEETVKPDHIQIVTTLFPQYDFVKAIGGDDVTVTKLVPPGVDVHSYEPTPADIINLNEADLFIYTGEEMEPWAHRLLASVDSDLVVVDTSENIVMHAVADHDDHDDHDHDDHHGHDHTVDPHIWTSPVNAKIMVSDILAAMVAAFPEREAVFTANANAYLAQLEELDADFLQMTAQSARKTIYHSGRFAMNYLTDEYGIEVVAAPFETEPSAALVVEMINDMNDAHIPVIFYEELVQPRLAQTIAEATSAQPLLLHSVHNVSADDLNNNVTYLGLMRQNLENLRIALND